MRILSIMMVDPNKNEEPTAGEIEKMHALLEELRANGVLVDTGGRRSGLLELQMRRRNGSTTISDGPFAEAKEVVGGYALLEVRDREEAIVWSNRFLDVVGDATLLIHEVFTA